MSRGTPPRPGGYRPPVRHKHGSRRHERYAQVDERTEIAEYDPPWMTRAHEPDPYEERLRQAREDAWITSAIRRESDESLRELRARLSGETPAKVHITKAHRVVVWQLAQDLGLTSADLLVVINRQFGEYAPRSTSTIATIVATAIRQWLDTPEGVRARIALSRNEF